MDLPVISERIEWDIANPDNDPLDFARSVAREKDLSAEQTNQIALAISNAIQEKMTNRALKFAKNMKRVANTSVIPSKRISKSHLNSNPLRPTLRQDLGKIEEGLEEIKEFISCGGRIKREVKRISKLF